MTDCPYRDKRFSKCKFEARYDVSGANLPNLARLKLDDHEALEAFRSRVYVRDVCINCGRTIERTDRGTQP